MWSICLPGWGAAMAAGAMFLYGTLDVAYFARMMYTVAKARYFRKKSCILGTTEIHCNWTLLERTSMNELVYTLTSGRPAAPWSRQPPRSDTGGPGGFVHAVAVCRQRVIDTSAAAIAELLLQLHCAGSCRPVPAKMPPEVRQSVLLQRVIDTSTPPSRSCCYSCTAPGAAGPCPPRCHQRCRHRGAAVTAALRRELPARARQDATRGETERTVTARHRHLGAAIAELLLQLHCAGSCRPVPAKMPPELELWVQSNELSSAKLRAVTVPLPKLTSPNNLGCGESITSPNVE
ncbi:Uncharacterized protein OBRU01_00306 [Operophtera brumata]|uniref:Uncharacterized protein n=1 Tax=Operophtera brumata TaxID=104452 RepID=A0A0L7LV93_OPEBR|nr:Uncharacterized protein OBRU01_00306 [Operophtera brumata]